MLKHFIPPSRSACASAKASAARGRWTVPSRSRFGEARREGYGSIPRGNKQFLVIPRWLCLGVFYFAVRQEATFSYNINIPTLIRVPMIWNCGKALDKSCFPSVLSKCRSADDTFGSIQFLQICYKTSSTGV